MDENEKNNAFIITVTLSIMLLLLILFYIVSSKLSVIRVIDRYDAGIIEQSPEPTDSETNNEVDKNNSNTTNNNGAINNESKQNEINENTTSQNNTDEGNSTTPPEEQKKEEIKITSQNLNWTEDTKLNLFQNKEIENKEIIWPGIEGTYNIDVKNALKLDANYTISFKETNINNINMKYKLKRNGEYVVDTWTSIEDISLKVDLLKADETDVYVLEWKWVEEDNETDTSKKGMSYKVEISIYSEQI